MRRGRAATTIACLSALLAAASLAWVGWIVLEPRYWFANAYAPKGAPGDEGPQGPVGPPGPPGPVGPEAADAVAALTSRVRDLEDALFLLEDTPADLDDLETEVERLRQTVERLCYAINQYVAVNTASEELVTELNDACA